MSALRVADRGRDSCRRPVSHSIERQSASQCSKFRAASGPRGSSARSQQSCAGSGRGGSSLGHERDSRQGAGYVRPYQGDVTGEGRPGADRALSGPPLSAASERVVVAPWIVRLLPGPPPPMPRPVTTFGKAWVRFAHREPSSNVGPVSSPVGEEADAARVGRIPYTLLPQLLPFRGRREAVFPRLGIVGTSMLVLGVGADEAARVVSPRCNDAERLTPVAERVPAVRLGGGEAVVGGPAGDVPPSKFRKVRQSAGEERRGEASSDAHPKPAVGSALCCLPTCNRWTRACAAERMWMAREGGGRASREGGLTGGSPRPVRTTFLRRLCTGGPRPDDRATLATTLATCATYCTHLW